MAMMVFLRWGCEGQRSAVATAQITATLRAMTISAHSGYWGRKANMTMALHSASTIATTRPQVTVAGGRLVNPDWVGLDRH